MADRHTAVILGGGPPAGLIAARQPRRLPDPADRVVVVPPGRPRLAAGEVLAGRFDGDPFEEPIAPNRRLPVKGAQARSGR